MAGMAKSAAYMKQKTPNGVQMLYSSLWGATPVHRYGCLSVENCGLEIESRKNVLWGKTRTQR